MRCSRYFPRFTQSNVHVTNMSSACHSYVLVCHPYVTRMFLYVTRMSLIWSPHVTPMNSCVTRMYLYAIPMPLVCTRKSLVSTRMSFVCHSYITRMSLVCQSYVTRMYSCVICVSHVCLVCHWYVLVCHL